MLSTTLGSVVSNLTTSLSGFCGSTESETLPEYLKTWLESF